MTEIQHNELQFFLQNFKELFNGTLGTWGTDAV